MKRKYNFNFQPKTKSFPHQIETIEYITTHSNVALFDEQGLGKTKIVIEALCNNMAEKVIDGALIICKKSLINIWKDEIEKHSFLKYIVLRGTSGEKGLKFMGFSHFYLINYAGVINEVNRLKMFLKIKKMAVVLDESHKIKNPSSKTAIAILSLRELASKRVLISGTPIANRPIDLWAQFYFLDSGKLLGRDFNGFKKQYSTKLPTNNLNREMEKFQKLRQVIESNSIRRLKSGVLSLPDKRYYNIYVQLQGKQRELYEQLKRKLYIEIKDIAGNVIIDESSALLKKLLRLAQIASNPFLIDKSYKESPIKFKKLDELVKKILDRGEKLIIWSSFVENIRILYRKYRNFGSLRLYGGIPIERREVIVKQFVGNDKFKILVANPSVAREGLTLTSANNAIYIDRNFNLVDYIQSQDRIHRISQTEICNIYKLIAKDTIDEYIDEIIYKKHDLAEYIQGDIDKLQERRYLTKEDILKILG